MRIKFYLLALTLIITNACVFAPYSEEVTGHFSMGLEGSFLTPCGTKEVWLVKGGASLVKSYQKMNIAEGESVFVRVKGYKGPDQHENPIYNRVFTVAKLLEMRKATDHDCPDIGYLAQNFNLPEVTAAVIYMYL